MSKSFSLYPINNNSTKLFYNYAFSCLTELPKGSSVLLFSEEYEFIHSAVVCCWELGLNPILAPDIQEQTLKGLASKVQGLLTPLELHSKTHSELLLKPTSKVQKMPTSLLVNKQHVAIQFFTSGSTGQRNCVKKNFSQLLLEVETLNCSFGKHIENKRWSATVSPRHIYGFLFGLFWPIHLSLDSKHRPKNLPYRSLFWDEILSSKYNSESHIIISSPSHISHLPTFLKQSPKLDIQIFSSGGPLKWNIVQQLLELFYSAPTEVFGSTETGGIAYRQRQSENDLWLVFDPIQVKSSTGVLELNSPWAEPCNQWIVTDDLATIHPRGFQLLGRKDRIVKISEKRVSLNEVENLLQRLPEISIAKVFADLDSKDKNTLYAVIELTPPGIDFLNKIGKRPLQQHFKKQLSSQVDLIALPKYWRFEKIPNDSQGKVNLESLKNLFRLDTL